MELPVSPVTNAHGDVLARFTVRLEEYAASTRLAAHLISTADQLSFRVSPAEGTEGTTGAEAQPTAVRSGVGIVEGWRGTIVHRVEVDPDGRLMRAKIVDPSWFNWPAIPVALADTIVPDFPLTNKSFNLSYAGNDL